MKKIDKKLDLVWEENIFDLEKTDKAGFPMLVFTEDPFNTFYYLTDRACPKCTRPLYRLKVDDGYNYLFIYTCEECRIFLGEEDTIDISKGYEEEVYIEILEKSLKYSYKGLDEGLLKKKIEFIIIFLNALGVKPGRERDQMRNKMIYKDPYLLQIYTGMYYYPYSLKKNFKKERFTYKAMTKVLVNYMLDRLALVDFKSEEKNEYEELMEKYDDIYGIESIASNYNYFKGSPAQAIDLDILSRENIEKYASLLKLEEDEAESLIKKIFEYVFAILLFKY